MWAESTHISVKKKNLQKIDIKRTYFNIINPYMTKPQQTLCSMMKNWKIKKKTRISTFTTIIQHNFGSLSPTNKKERKIEEIQMEKEIKLSLFTDDMILCIENPEDVTRKLLELINEFVNLKDTRLMHWNILNSYTLTMKMQKEKLKKQSHLTVQQ